MADVLSRAWAVVCICFAAKWGEEGVFWHDGRHWQWFTYRPEWRQ